MIGCEPAPRLAPVVDVGEMYRLFEHPLWTPEEWERQCHRRGEDEHCSIVVQIDCPPDCGVYKLVWEDTLARRVWE